MTANQMADRLELLLNKVDSYSGFSYEDSELSGFLNVAQITYLQSFADRVNNRKNTGFEEEEARGWGLAPLIKSSTLAESSDQTGAFTNGVYYSLPTDFQAFLTEIPTSDQQACNSETLIIPDVVVISHDEYKRLIKNYYKKPYIGNTEGIVWRMYDNGKRVQLITDGSFEITEYFVKYLKSVPEIVVDRVTTGNQVNCVLGDNNSTGLNPVHETIVEIAKKLIDESTGEKRTSGIPGQEQLH